MPPKKMSWKKGLIGRLLSFFKFPDYLLRAVPLPLGHVFLLLLIFSPSHYTWFYYTGAFHISDHLIDELLSDYEKPEDLLGEDGILKDLPEAWHGP